jgi:hypothetical protein
MERRLAAILVADMAGYSRLMEQDEAGVLERQKAHRRELIDPEIARRGGHVVKTTPAQHLRAGVSSALHKRWPGASRAARELEASSAPPGRGDGFPGSHGPAENEVDQQWLITGLPPAAGKEH